MTGIPIDFLVAGGGEVGLGHVVRSARLAREAARRGWKVRGFVDGDVVARDAWRATSGEAALPPPRDIDGLAPIVALDDPEEKTASLQRLDRLGSRPLVVDDARDYPRMAGAPRGWRLLPGLHHRRVETSGATDPNGFALLSGPRYAIVDEAHRALPPLSTAERSSLLVSLGGSDPLRAGPPVARAAQEAVEALGLPLTVDVVFGPAFDDAGGREADRLRAIGCRLHHALDADGMAARMHAARLAIIGFGTSASELAWHGTPFLTVAHHDADRGPARDLEAFGFGRVLGNATNLDRAPIASRVRRALCDPQWLDASATAGRRALGDGLGAARVFDRLDADLALRPRGPRAAIGEDAASA